MKKANQKIYKFLQFVNQMKLIDRLSLVSKDGRRESDAEHAWHLVMFIWMYSFVYEKKIDLLRAIKIGLIHDMVEILAGDVYGLSPDVKFVDRRKAEEKAILNLCTRLPDELAKEANDLWREYEKRKSEESKYVWALDKICPRFQLTLTGKDLSKGMSGDKEKGAIQEEAISKISPIFKEVLEKIRVERS